MTDDEFFDAHFPEAASLLQDLRAKDNEFDQICMDYRELFMEVAQLPQPAVTLHSRYLADLVESLSDLRTSIEMSLRSYGRDAVDQRNDTGEV
ncbi:hypothetical protein HW561_20830 [Rhodobacteraceae bacterium B1Z28]|uniref:Uncharacterized protein n=1 Tax=Ruegeria haliotis TaxID=2747601 RepID=A0ABX2PY44_9RHOB|nr:hypothetical protein [Ruegeria haliotis]NVO58236.1 hypothetical protein [Ruegeria haliotis]